MPPGIGYKRRPIDPRLAEILAQMGSPQGDISPVFSPGPRTDQGVFPGAEAAFGKFLARSPQGMLDTTAEDLSTMSSIAGTVGDQGAAFRAGQAVRKQIAPAIEGISELGIGGTAKAVGGGVAKAIDERGLGAFMSLLDIPTGGLGAAALGGMGLVADIGKASRGLKAAGKLPTASISTVGGIEFTTGKPVTFEFIRNTEKAPNMGSTYGQDIEPAGKFMQQREQVFDLPPGMISGEVTFKSPLVIEHGDTREWKKALTANYGGKTGKNLSKAILADGFDGIVTVNSKGGYASEIVDLSVVGDIGKATRGLRAAGKLPDFSDLKSNAEIEAFVIRHAENDSRFSSRLAEARGQDKPRAGRPFEAQVLQEVDASLRSENPDFSLIADRALENRPSRAEGLDVAFPSQVKGARAGKVNDLAISEFGETQDWNEAGYLLSDGKMLDFSGKRDGGQGGMRAQDHREISDVFEPENRGHSSGMIEFMDLGNVRMMPESGGIGMVHKPTEQQRGALAGFIRKNDGEVIIDLEDGIGEYDAANEMYRQPKRRFSREYPQGTKHQRVFKDIGDFFSGNEPAELSQMGQFR